VNLERVSSAIIVDYSNQSENKTLNAQRGVNSNKAQRGFGEERCDWESNIEMEGRQNENQ